MLGLRGGSGRFKPGVGAGVLGLRVGLGRFKGVVCGRTLKQSKLS